MAQAALASLALLAALGAPAALAASQLSWSGQKIAAGAINAISCPSESLCVAVDGKGDAYTSVNPTAALPAWGTQHIDGRPLSAVSCASLTLCVAVDDEGNALTSVNPSGASPFWGGQHIDGHALTSVSCVATVLCVAVDAEGSALATSEPGSPGAFWKAIPIDAGRHLQSVSCSGPSSCVAVDSVGRALGSENPTVFPWPGRAITSALTAVSCSPAGPCVATDSEGFALASANAGSPFATWSSTPVDAGGHADAISCAASGLCVAVDEHGTALASDNPLAAVPSWSASSADSERLSGISCLPGGLCVASDVSGRILSGRVPIPDVASTPPAEAGASEATIASVVNPHDATLGTCTFEYGSSPAYGQSVPCTSLPSPSGGAQIVSAAVAGLSPNTTYHYRLLAGSLGGLRVGPDQSFTTAISSSVSRVTPHPAIHGTPAVGSRLSCASGVASGAARLSFAWLRDLIAIPRATSSNYTVVGQDVGHHLQCEVSASNAGGTVTARSSFVTIPVQGVVAAAGETVVGGARFLKGAVRVPIRCSSKAPAGCRIAIRVISTARTAVLLGGVRVRLARGQHRTVLAPLNSLGKRLAAHGRHPTVRVTVTGTVIGVIESTLSQQRVRL